VQRYALLTEAFMIGSEGSKNYLRTRSEQAKSTMIILAAPGLGMCQALQISA
jgi:hypothetical protein